MICALQDVLRIGLILECYVKNQKSKQKITKFFIINYCMIIWLLSLQIINSIFEYLFNNLNEKFK